MLVVVVLVVVVLVMVVLVMVVVLVVVVVMVVAVSRLIPCDPVAWGEECPCPETWVEETV